MSNKTNLPIVVTGASGYIGGQTVLELKAQGHTVVGIDRELPPLPVANAANDFYHGDFSSMSILGQILELNPGAIIHCAGTSLVGPSMTNPSEYYENNFVKTKKLLDFMVGHGLQERVRFIFSSSASVYGEPVMVPCQEEDPAAPLSPYGESKYMIEIMLSSYFRAYGLQPVMFRYFNACGADPLGRHGQAAGATHIIARALESLINQTNFVLNGDQYPTPDGTCIRDYVHVSDIASAHVAALDASVPTGVYNLSTNCGTSNKEIIDLVEKITGEKINLSIGQPRDGDPAVLTARADRFESICPGWRNYSLEDMIKHAWTWYKKDRV